MMYPLGELRGGPCRRDPQAPGKTPRGLATGPLVRDAWWRKGGQRVTLTSRDPHIPSWHPALALIALLAVAGCKKENAYVPPPPPDVGVAKPLQQAVTPYLEVTGNTAAYNQVDLDARIEGFLKEIDYTDGAMASRGDTLFVIEPAPYQAKLQQAQASLAAAQAALAQSEPEFVRQETLLKQNVSAQNTYDQALAKRDSDRANVSNQQAGVTIAAINYGYTRVTAPFDGEMTNHLQSVGELVGVSGPTKLASIVQLDPIYVTFNVSEQDVLRIKAMMRERGLTAFDLAKIPVEVGLMTEQGYPHAEIGRAHV